MSSKADDSSSSANLIINIKRFMSKETHWGELTIEERLEELRIKNKNVISELYEIKQALAKYEKKIKE